jgi:hypothetical protein
MSPVILKRERIVMSTGWQKREPEPPISRPRGAVRMLRARMVNNKWREAGDVIPIEHVSKSLSPPDCRLDQVRAESLIREGFAEKAVCP